MAQKVNIVLIDDIDGSDAEETVSFGLDGKDYLIDLNSAHASDLRDALAPYLGHARTGSSRRGARKSAASNGSRSSSTSEAAKIREWARSQGHDVPERGRLPKEVKEAYEAAH